MEHTKGKDDYRVRLVLEKCIFTPIGNWCDTQQIKSRIFFGVSVDKSEAEKDFIQSCKSIESHDALLVALQEFGEHKADCAIIMPRVTDTLGPGCTCGLGQAIAEAKEC
jgi:hypothetical protein